LQEVSGTAFGKLSAAAKGLATPLKPSVEAVGKPHFDNHPISETIYGADE
jgi:hypothetical protein